LPKAGGKRPADVDLRARAIARATEPGFLKRVSRELEHWHSSVEALQELHKLLPAPVFVISEADKAHEAVLLDICVMLGASVAGWPSDLQPCVALTKPSSRTLTSHRSCASFT
jgi:hypothetical protein